MKILQISKYYLSPQHIFKKVSNIKEGIFMEYPRESNCESSTNLNINLIKSAMETQTIICSKALVYEKDVGLHFNLGGFEAIMPNDEVIYSPTNKTVKEAAVATRVNKNVCFVITKIDPSPIRPVIYVSRRKVQKEVYENYISTLSCGDVIKCTITHVDSFGVFCDVGYGVNALLPIDFISVSRINSPSDRFYEGQDIYACVKSIDCDGRIVLTHKELLGTWLENAALFAPMSTTVGIVRSIENYGIFIELMPNLAGLAEVCDGVEVGDVVNVYIKSILPDKMKVKLVIMSTLKNFETNTKIRYFIKDGHINSWHYSTPESRKSISTIF